MQCMSKKVVFTIPDRWVKRWEKIKAMLKLNDDQLMRKMIKQEMDTWESEKRIEAHERVERALAMIDDKIGEEEMLEFAKQVELIAKKLIEVKEE